MRPHRRLLIASALMLAATPPEAHAQTTESPKPPVPAAAPTSPPLFADAARTVTASIQKSFYNEKTGLYAQSVDKPEPEFTWGNGVMFSALAAAARNEPVTYRPLLDKFFAAMDRYWDAKAPLPGYEPAPTAGNGNDKYYDDNQWMVITFTEAYDVTQDARYLDRADAALKFSLSGWDEQLGGGIWWHQLHKGGAKNTCANGPAAVACLRVGRYRDRSVTTEWARRIVKWTNEHLQDKDGLFGDHQRVADKHVNGGRLTYNSALMIRANLGLYRATSDASFLNEAKRIGTACDFFTSKETGAYRDGPRFAHLLVEADLELYRATGDAHLLARARKNGAVMWARWQASPPKELIEQAAIARTLWLLADQESASGRAFWAHADAVPPLP